MQNTFWTLVEDSYFRVHDGVLKTAPLCSDTSSVKTSQESVVKSISPDILEKVNGALGINLSISDI